MRPNHRSGGFTLIELLIVVAIIAILAAIAVPNFLEAQTRSKVSRVKADMRSIATALEAYVVDNNSYPQCSYLGVVTRPGPSFSGSTVPVLERLTTPIAYITSVLSRDPFAIKTRLSASNAQGIQTATPTVLTSADPIFAQNSMIYQAWNTDMGQRAATTVGGSDPAIVKATTWLFHSAGPDGNYYNLGGVLANDRVAQLPYTMDLIYDPTNGTVSRGSIWRWGGSPSSGATYAGGEGLRKAIDTQR